jgi:hypothetical protein
MEKITRTRGGCGIKKYKLRPGRAFLFVTFLFVVSVPNKGSASDTDTIKVPAISILKVPDRDFSIGHVTVSRTGFILKMFGSGRLRNAFIRGHIYISVKNPSGTLLTSSSIKPEFRRRGKKSFIAKTTAYYSATFTVPDTAVSQVIVAFHRDRIDKRSSQFDCGSNQAADRILPQK